MKRLVLISAVAVFLSGIAVQATSTISWDFNTLGDTEGWGTTGDSHNSLTNGIIVTNAVQGSEVVLSTLDITGIDPGVVTATTSSVPSGEYWDTIEIRLRTLSGNGGIPIAYNEAATLMVINGQVVSPGSAWTKTYEANEWVVTSYDISGLVSDDITSLRLDPPAGIDQNFEYDYIRLHTNTNAPPPPVYKTDWEFNTPGDLEGWVGNVVGVMVAGAVGGSESVLTCSSADVGDPQTWNNFEPANIEPGHYWSAVELRIRHVNGGVPAVWDPAGTLFRVNNVSLSTTVGGDDWKTTADANGWIVTRFDMSYLGQANIFIMRIDPFSVAEGRNFEIDYVRFETRSTPPLPPAPAELIHGWEFNTLGDTEDVTARSDGRIVGLTAANAITGSEGVLTSADIAHIDPMVFYNDEFSNPALAITPPGPWTSVELRIRTIGGNPSTTGVTSIPFVASGTLLQINPWTGATVLDPAVVTPEADNWLVVTYDLSYLGMDNLDGFRLDPVGNNEAINFEVDYIRAYSEGTSYDAWSQVVYGLEGTNALTTADADGDTYNNLYEYAFGGDPTNPAEHGFVESGSVVAGGTSYFEYNYARRTGFNTGLEYALEQRGNLTFDPWVNIGDTAEVGTMQITDDYEVVTNRIETVDSLEFLRAEVIGE